jgi:hypothetical protein
VRARQAGGPTNREHIALETTVEKEIVMSRKELIKEYKSTLRPMGIVQVKNRKNGKVYLAASANTPGTINSIRFQLRMGAFLPSAELAKDWKEMGEESFSFEVIDELKPVDDPGHDYGDDLKALEAMWMEKLRPCGERGYHSGAPVW